jgi:Winged helix-turn-helix DNA-binding
MVSRGTTQQSSAPFSRRMVLDVIRRQGTISRREIVELVSLSPQTVANITNDLQAIGLIVAKRLKGPKSCGQPPIAFELEHYPIEPGKVAWSSLYEEAHWVTHIMQVWREDGVPRDVPLIISESNPSSQYSEAYLDLFAGLWLADYVGAFFAGGGNALYYFHYLPEAIGSGHNGSPGTFNFFAADQNLKIQQPLAQYFVSQMINL